MPPSPASESTPAWEVISQRETTQASPAGVFTTGVTVMYRTAAGVYGSVFVPMAQYNADNVKAMISAATTVHDAVGQLRG